MSDETGGDPLGDRMKDYEGREAGRRLMPRLPVLARLDGRNFSTFTRGLPRPYDERLSELMRDTTRHLVEETVALCGYTQSDEITLAWYAPAPGSQMIFDGRVQKLTSVLAALASVSFNSRLAERIPERADRCPVFDCRVWSVPSVEEGANCFLWREQDAVKNSITMAAQCHYSHTELMGKNGREKQELLFAKGVNWNDYPAFFKRGAYVRRRTTRVPFSTEELDRLPEKHEARTYPGLLVERSVVEELDLPPLGTVTNRAGVIFGGEEPRTDRK